MFNKFKLKKSVSLVLSLAFIAGQFNYAVAQPNSEIDFPIWVDGNIGGDYYNELDDLEGIEIVFDDFDLENWQTDFQIESPRDIEYEILTLEEMPISRSRFVPAPERTNLTIGNIDEVEENQILSSEKPIRTSSNEWFRTFTGFITNLNDMQFIYTDLFPGEVLDVEVHMPTNSNIDYDVVLLEIGAFGNLIMVDSSENSTFINPNGQTVPETVSFFNNSN